MQLLCAGDIEPVKVQENSLPDVQANGGGGERLPICTWQPASETNKMTFTQLVSGVCKHDPIILDPWLSLSSQVMHRR